MNAMLTSTPVNRESAIRDAVSAHCVRLELTDIERETCVRSAVTAFLRGSSAAWAIAEGKTDADAIARSPTRALNPASVTRMPTLEERILAAMDGRNAMTVEDVCSVLRVRQSRQAEVGRLMRRLALGRDLIRHAVDGEPTMYSRPSASSRKAQAWRANRGRM